MNTIKSREFLRFANAYEHISATARRRFRRLLPILAMFAAPLGAATVDADYDSRFDVPIAASSYTATGNTLALSLNFTPTTGTSLTVIRMTGLNFIQGEFDNLAHGQMVTLNQGGRKYYFTANYHGHEGRDLVLQWTNVRPYAWGGGANGKLGNDASDDSRLPLAVNVAGAFWGKFVSSGAAGGGHSLTVCSDGTVVSWGLNTNGQLGDNSTQQRDVPVSVNISGVPSTRKVVAVAAGANHSLALCSDGTVVSWGLNTSGQLGNNSTAQSTSPVNVSVAGVLSGKTVVAVSAGANHSMALCSDGTVAAWGLNSSGQLGNNSTAQSNVPVAVTTASGALVGKSVIAVSAGASHSLALCSDGSVVAWGLNTNGQLGNSGTAQSNLPAAVTKTSGALFGKSVTMVAAGASHSLALCSDGSVASWGLNTGGQLGNGNNSQNTAPVAVFASGLLNGRTVFMVSAGANHSIAHCNDGTVATWGANASGQLGDNSFTSSNVPVAVATFELHSGGISAAVSGSSASHTLALAAFPEIDLSNCGFIKQANYSQSSGSDPEPDPESPFNFYGYANSGTMGELLASSFLTPPVGGSGSSVYEKGSMGLGLNQIFRTKSALDAAYPTGSYLMTIRTSIPNTYQVALTLGGDNYPTIPKVIGFTNASWVNGALKVTNPANPVVITWSNPANHDTRFQVDNSGIFSANSGPASQFTIPGNTLNGDSFYRASVQFMNGSSSSSVPGLPDSFANSGYHTQLRFLIQVGTPESDAPLYIVAKNHNQVQTSNSDPVDSPNNLPDSDLAPYSMTAESPLGGTLSGPSGKSFPLRFYADNDGGIYEYLSEPIASAAALNISHPNGTYQFPGGVSVNLPGDSYPATAKILTVNGAAPIWNAQGQLALDPTIDNTITWTAVNVPNFATQGHQEVEFVNYQDFNFENIQEERGPFADDLTPITSLLVPKFSMTPTFTYIGQVQYANAVSITPLGGEAFALGVYETGNQFMAVALKPQSISFGTIAPKTFPGADFQSGAGASSGLPVSYEIVSGPATVSGSTVSIVGAGTVIIRASQDGNGVFASAVSVTQSFEVSYASDLAEFRATKGLASDGSQDLLKPAGDDIANLLKYAFNMVGSGTGQAPSLSTPNVQVLAVAGNAGLPRNGVSVGKLTLTYVRRKVSSNPGIAYAVEFSNALSADSWGVNGSALESVANIDTDFERVTVTDSAVFPKRFARVRVTAN